MTVRFLDQTLINQIAAGEVIERPSSAIKELIENSIDAGSTKIEVMIREGGKTYISVVDNGCGMSPDDLTLAVERHATSKIPDNDLFNIHTLGFRGEALPSIGSVSRLKITSRQNDSDNAWELFVEGGVKSQVSPSSGPVGTKIEIRDLFYATPARLKFLKAASTELTHIVDIIERLALINPQIDFTLRDGDKHVLAFTSGINRFEAVLGKEFHENCCEISCMRGDLTLKGAISIPTYNHSSAANQYLFVNGRPVKDKLLAVAVRVGYQDVLAGNRYPSLCLFLECSPEEVDINVHPAKSEVRFRDPNLVRNFVISALRETLRGNNSRSSTVMASDIVQAMMATPLQAPASSRHSQSTSSSGFRHPSSPGLAATSIPRLSMPFNVPEVKAFEEQLLNPLSSSLMQLPQHTTVQAEATPLTEANYLGHAKAQIHETYIIAETNNHLIIVDQHAAHERLVYEKMKQDLNNGLIKRQALLIPEVIELSEQQTTLIESYLDLLNSIGFLIEIIGNKGLIIRESPTLLNNVPLRTLILDMISELKDKDTAETIPQKIHEILADKACKNSIRAGRKLSFEEMNALLRQMEDTPSSGQCNHGRPTFVKLDKQALEKLFGRT